MNRDKVPMGKRSTFLIDVLARSWAREQAVVGVGVFASMLWFTAFNQTLLPGVLIPVAAGLGLPLLFVRSWKVWDVYEWHIRARLRLRPRQPGPEFLALEHVALALASRQTTEARALLNQLQLSSPSAIVAVASLRATTDLLDKRVPDLQPVLDAVALFGRDDVRYPGLLVQLAGLDAGIASLRHEDWRRPLVECHRELGIKLNLWRALWPTRRILITAGLILGFVVVVYRYPIV